MNAKVMDVFKTECITVSKSTVHVIAHVSESHQLTLDEALHTAASAGFSVGLELGLAIAVTDIAAGRMLLRFYRDVREAAGAEGAFPGGMVDQSDQARQEMADRFLEVLK